MPWRRRGRPRVGTAPGPATAPPVGGPPVAVRGTLARCPRCSHSVNDSSPKTNLGAVRVVEPDELEVLGEPLPLLDSLVLLLFIDLHAAKSLWCFESTRGSPPCGCPRPGLGFRLPLQVASGLVVCVADGVPVPVPSGPRRRDVPVSAGGAIEASCRRYRVSAPPASTAPRTWPRTPAPAEPRTDPARRSSRRLARRLGRLGRTVGRSPGAGAGGAAASSPPPPSTWVTRNNTSARRRRPDDDQCPLVTFGQRHVRLPRLGAWGSLTSGLGDLRGRPRPALRSVVYSSISPGS